jgi:hypothetical protein
MLLMGSEVSVLAIADITNQHDIYIGLLHLRNWFSTPVPDNPRPAPLPKEGRKVSQILLKGDNISLIQQLQ